MPLLPTYITNDPIVDGNGRPTVWFQDYINGNFQSLRTNAAAAASAQSAADNALAQSNDAATDGIITPHEKFVEVIPAYNYFTGTNSDLVAKATSYGTPVATQLSNYNTAYSAWTTYLATLTSPVMWNDTSGNTNITRSVWQTKWGDMNSKRTLLDQAMTAQAGAQSTWTGVSGTGKPADNATVGADLGTNVTGRLTNGGGTMPINWNGGIKSLNSGFALSDSVVDSSTCQINIAATTWQFDNGNVVNYPSGTITGCSYATTYYVYRTDPALNGGSSYGASTDIANAQSTSKVYFGYLTTRASSGSGTGGTGGGGGTFNCVAIDAFVPTERGLLPAHEVVAGDRVHTLTKSLDGTAWETVEENVVGDNYCVRMTTKSASLTLAHNTPIIDRNGAWTMAANAHACHLPVLLNGKVVWEKCESVEHVGKKPVMKLRCKQAIYAAGNTSDAFILTHNFGSNTQKP